MLVKEYRGKGGVCSLCNKKLKFKCSHNLYASKACSAALCSQHARLMREEESVGIVPQRLEDNRPAAPQRANDDDETDDLLVPQGL